MSSFLQRLAVAVAVFVISGAAILVATFFFFAALYFWFNEFLHPAAAALATAGVLIGFAVLVVILGVAISSLLKRKPRQRFDWLLDLLDAPDGLSAAAVGNALGRKLSAFAQKNAQATVIASLLAGLAIGISPGLRALLREVLKD
jgi:hypothetical protein